MAKKGLGRGLDALLSEPAAPIREEVSSKPQTMRIADLEPNMEQPRKHFDQEQLEALADSIKEHGLIQPIIIQKAENGFYRIIAGERRWRAAKLAGLKQVPVIQMELSEQATLEIALVENIQRQDLNPIEEADAYGYLMKKFGLTQEEVSKKVGKSRSAVANSLRLTNLPEEVRELLVTGALSAGHARTLIGVEDKDLQIRLAQQMAEEGWSVRQAEQAVAKLLRPKKEKETEQLSGEQMFAYEQVAKDLSEKLGLKVRIQPTGKKKKLEIEYYEDDDLNRILDYFGE